MTEGAQLPQAKFELDQLTVAVLTEGPHRNDHSEEETQRLLDEHLDYTIALVRSGHLLHAGALIDDATQLKLTGLSFSRLSVPELEPLIANDPAVIAGVESVRFLTHVFPKGSLSFLSNTASEPELAAAKR